MTTGSKVRAVRNNNPGNIEKGDPWQGLMAPEDMTPDQAAEQRFCVFKAPKWGFRAFSRTLITYQDKKRAKDGSIIDTVTEVIVRWAPPNENDTVAYIRNVCKLSGLEANQKIDLHKYEDAFPLIKAMSHVECGGWFFDDDDLEAGLKLAGVPRAVEALTSSRTIRAATVASAATSLSLVADTVNDIQPLTGLIREMAEYAPTVAGLAVLGLLCAIIYYRFDDWRRERG